ncbi:MAG: methionine adenosyltransferase [Proteobacteria bacterium]|nr:methionine adenosyltransferase [Pseudomonadota bacterium]
MNNVNFFSSESVSVGHPDKLADQIADAILDAALLTDKDSRVACEVLLKSHLVFVVGEITTDALIDIDEIVKSTIRNAGYNNKFGFDANCCSIISSINKQSIDIKKGIEQSFGAGDQGIMFGFACRETKQLMPAPITYAQSLMQMHKNVIQKNKLPWLGPDAKTQITVAYREKQVEYIDKIVFSSQHLDGVSETQIYDGILQEIIKPTFQKYGFDISNTKILINPAGRFVIGGPIADSGLTGRKIIVDTYGGAAKHGGGSFSGKDPTKVDRSGAYIARHIAKSIVANNIAERCEIQISYAIGVAEPQSLSINCFGTNNIPEYKIINLIKSKFNLTPRGIIEYLGLLNPIYNATSMFGHFGHENFSWERITEL